MITAVVVGIVVTLSISSFKTARERQLNKLAKNNLRIIKQAEEAYMLEMGTYWPNPGYPQNPEPDLADINRELALAIPSTDWSYRVWSNGSNFSALATRTNAPAGWGRIFSIWDSANEACCCPSGSCSPAQGCLDDYCPGACTCCPC